MPAAKAKQNDQPVAPTALEQQTFTLELFGAELELIHNMVTHGQFPTVDLKRIATSLQAKVEQVAQQEMATP